MRSQTKHKYRENGGEIWREKKEVLQMAVISSASEMRSKEEEGLDGLGTRSKMLPDLLSFGSCSKNLPEVRAERVLLSFARLMKNGMNGVPGLLLTSLLPPYHRLLVVYFFIIRSET